MRSRSSSTPNATWTARAAGHAGCVRGDRHEIVGDKEDSVSSTRWCMAITTILVEGQRIEKLGDSAAHDRRRVGRWRSAPRDGEGVGRAGRADHHVLVEGDRNEQIKGQHSIQAERQEKLDMNLALEAGHSV